MKSKYLIILLWIISGTLNADVIYSPYTDFGTALSLEFIGNYELSFSNFNTFGVWGGFGAVSMIGSIKNPAFGSEIAIEFRQYFKSNTFENLNLGLYAGFAYMRFPYFYRGSVTRYDNSIGFVPGIKLAYKKKINSLFICEPYIGLSAPWYGENLEQIIHWISHSDPGLILTFGFRIGLNKIKLKNE